MSRWWGQFMQPSLLVQENHYYLMAAWWVGWAHPNLLWLFLCVVSTEPLPGSFLQHTSTSWRLNWWGRGAWSGEGLSGKFTSCNSHCSWSAVKCSLPLSRAVSWIPYTTLYISLCLPICFKELIGLFSFFILDFFFKCKTEAIRVAWKVHWKTSIPSCVQPATFQLKGKAVCLKIRQSTLLQNEINTCCHLV